METINQTLKGIEIRTNKPTPGRCEIILYNTVGSTITLNFDKGLLMNIRDQLSIAIEKI